MKVLWIAGILIGFGLIAGGAIYYYYGHHAGGYMITIGFAVKAMGLMARRQVFRRGDIRNTES